LKLGSRQLSDGTQQRSQGPPKSMLANEIVSDAAHLACLHPEHRRLCEADLGEVWKDTCTVLLPEGRTGKAFSISRSHKNIACCDIYAYSLLIWLLKSLPHLTRKIYTRLEHSQSH
jgi:hypothetical protein